MEHTTKKIVIVGGGFGGVYAALELKKLFTSSTNVEVTLVSKENYFLFTPLLHEVATGSVNQSNIIQPLRHILSSRVKFLLAEARQLDPKNQTLQTSRGSINYDYLILAVGSQSNVPEFLKESGYDLKSLSDAKKIKNQLIGNFGSAALLPKNSKERQGALTVVVLGGGPTGVELAAEIEEFFTDLLFAFPEIEAHEPKIILVQRNSKILPAFHENISRKGLQILTKKHKKLKILLDNEAVKYQNYDLTLKNGQVIHTQTVVFTTGIKPALFPVTEKLPINNKGQILVNENLQILGYKNLYAVGDMAALRCEKTSLPQSAQAAEKSGKAAALNIYRQINGLDPKTFVFKESGQLVSLGRWKAAAEIKGFAFSGHFAWWVWRTIYAAKMPGWAKKIRIVLDWTIDIFYPRDISRL